MATTVTGYAEKYSSGHAPLSGKAGQRFHLEEAGGEFKGIVGDSPALKAALELVSLVAPTDGSVRS